MVLMAQGKREIVLLPSGVTTDIHQLTHWGYDWPSIKVLAEKGVSYTTISAHYKGLDRQVIADRARHEGWITPARERKMRKELAKRQAESLRNTGVAKDPKTAMEEIWKERQERSSEEAYRIVEKALAGVDDERAAMMIRDAKDLKTVVDVARKVTGQERREQEEADRGPKLAVNIGFLRSAGVRPIDV